MRRIYFILILLLAAPLLRAQTAALNGHSFLGGVPAKTQGLNSTNYLNGIIPSATICVYLTGTKNLATIYKDAQGTPLSSCFTSNAANSVNPGGWLFFAATNQGYDVVGSGGIAPNVYPQDVPLCTDCYPGFNFTPASGGTPGGSSGAIQYNDSGSFGGATITGVVASNGSGVPAAATQTQITNPLFDANSNSVIGISTGASLPLPSTISNDLLWGSNTGQDIGQYGGNVWNVTGASGATTLTTTTDSMQPTDNIVGPGIPVGTTVLTVASNPDEITISQPTTEALSSTPETFYPSTVFQALGTGTSGSTTLTLNYAFPVQVYQAVSGTGISVGTTVTAVSGTTLTLSAALTSTISSSPVTIVPGNTGGLIAIGNYACANCTSNNGSIAIGEEAMYSFRGDGTDGEDSNSVAIGPFAYSGCSGYSSSAYPLFESTFIGNKVFGTGCGAADSQFVGNHIYGFFNATDSSIIGGEEGAGDGVNIIMNRVQATGDGEFNPVRSGGPTIPAGTYYISNTNIYGSISAQLMLNTHDNNVFGTESLDGGTYANTATENDVVGNGIANKCSTCYNSVFIGGSYGGYPTGGSYTTGEGGVFVGVGAGYAETTAKYPIAIGFESALDATGAVTAVGNLACENDSAQDICIGPYAGAGITAGGANIIIAIDNTPTGPTGAFTGDTEVGNAVGIGDNASNLSYFGENAGRRSAPSLGTNEAFGLSEFQAPSGATGTEQYDAFFGDTSSCDGCTLGISLGHNANIGAVAGAVQIGSGKNSTANTMQFQGYNFLTSAGAATFSAATVNGSAVCTANGSNCPTALAVAVPSIRAGTWSISSGRSVAVTFATAMTVAPTSCAVNPSASSATTGQPYATGFSTTGFTVQVPVSGSLTGTYQCVVNNAN